ncbi:MAG: hypothetical protein ACFFG0_46365, partial [Candidatus Thorarchaeota archaeon]
MNSSKFQFYINSEYISLQNEFRWFSIFNSFYQTYTKLTVVFVLLVGGSLTLQTQGVLTVGSLVLIILYLNQFLDPLLIITGIYSLIQSS